MPSALNIPCAGFRLPPAFKLDLHAQSMFVIDDAANVCIACVQGRLWITLDNDLRDVVLDECEVFTTLEHRRAIVYAMKASRVAITATAPFQSGALRHHRTQAKPLCAQFEEKMPAVKALIAH